MPQCLKSLLIFRRIFFPPSSSHPIFFPSFSTPQKGPVLNSGDRAVFQMVLFSSKLKTRKPSPPFIPPPPSSLARSLNANVPEPHRAFLSIHWGAGTAVKKSRAPLYVVVIYTYTALTCARINLNLPEERRRRLFGR